MNSSKKAVALKRYYCRFFGRKVGYMMHTARTIGVSIEAESPIDARFQVYERYEVFGRIDTRDDVVIEMSSLLTNPRARTFSGVA